MKDSQRKAIHAKRHAKTPRVTMKPNGKGGTEYIVSINGRGMYLSHKELAEQHVKDLKSQLKDERKRTGDNKSVWW